MRYICGSGTSVAGAFGTLHGTKPRKPENRPMHFVAVEMEETESSADVYYGRILRILEFDLSGIGNLTSGQETDWACIHQLV